MKKINYFLPVLLLLILIACKPMKKQVDLIVYNGIVYTVDNNFSTASVIVVDDGKIIEVGDKGLLDIYESNKTVDAAGSAVYPGFYDAHCHFLSYGLGKLQSADLRGTLSFDEVVERVQKHANTSEAEWILGRGWDQNDWEVKEFPVRSSLDELFPDQPVILTRIDGHAALVNGEALQRAGITAETKVVGGEVKLTDGIPNGILIDNAIELVSEIIPEHDPELLKAALLKAQEDCFAVGLTSVADAGMDVAVIKLIDSLHQSGELKMKVNAWLSPMDSTYIDFMKGGIYKTDRLHVNAIKVYADGALGSRGACMIEPYSDDPHNHGLIMYPEAYYREIMEQAIEYNYQVNTHAIGDSGNRIILDLYAEYLGGPNDKRWRIEHAQIVSPQDFEKFAAFNIIPSIQATHATSDMYWAEDRVGAERIKGAYAYKTLLSQNGWLPNGTDFPIEKISPLLTYYASVSRKDLEGYPDKGFQTEEALSREEALKSVSIWAAKGSFEEEEKGSLEVGKFADIVIVDKDIMKIPEEDIPDVKVLYTIINGELVYSLNDQEN